jgi:hypothetical protein
MRTGGVFMLQRYILPLAVLLAVSATGCSASGGYTVVEGRLKPGHFNFVPIIERKEPGGDGWQAACVHLVLKRALGEPYTCIFSVEMPIETTTGPISLVRARRHAAECANLAAQVALKATTPETPLGIACTNFVQTYFVLLGRALRGSRVTRRCHEVPE